MLALEAAASVGDVAAVRSLVEHKSNVEGDRGFSALMFAAGAGHGDVVDLLLSVTTTAGDDARAAERGHVLDAAGHGLGLRRRRGVRDQRVHDLPRRVLSC